MAVVFRASTKPTNGTAFQAGLDPLAVLYANTETTGVSMVRPTLSAHRVLRITRER